MSQDTNVGEAEAAGEPLSENTVEYMLFVIDSQQPDPRRARTRLEAIRKAAVELAQSLTKDYIWQREAFEISLKSEHGEYLHKSPLHTMPCHFLTLSFQDCFSYMAQPTMEMPSRMNGSSSTYCVNYPKPTPISGCESPTLTASSSWWKRPTSSPAG